MKVYKATDENMKCRGLQYELGKTVEEPVADLCSKGLHACTSPLDVLRYYEPGKGSRYFSADAEAVSDKKSDDSKIVCKKLTLEAEIGIPGLAKAHVAYVMEHLNKDDSAATNTGNCSAATNTGYRSAATVEGKDSIAVASGFCSKAKACLGSAICVCERGDWDGTTYPFFHVRAAIVDGVTLQPDTWYTLVNGEFQEVTEDA